MKTIPIRLYFILICLLSSFVLYSQDYSNKGTDFWLGYGYHVAMAGNNTNGGSQDMVLYFTSDKNAKVTVEIPGVGYTATFTVSANQTTISTPLPKSGAQDARINSIGLLKRGIHITSDEPIVAYTHIYNQSVSGATLLFPTNTLGKEYYSVNFTQQSNQNNSNSFFFVVATEDNTTIEITPSADNLNGLAPGVATTIPFTLNQGDVYSVFGTVSGIKGTDLTGSKVRSISTAGSVGCKKISVFSGSGKLSIGGAGNGPADNFIAQSLPAVAWGKKYLTAPTGSQPNNFYRVCVTNPNTVVKLNGNIIPNTNLINGFYYEFFNGSYNGTNPTTNPAIPNIIESDIPVLVAQYCTTQGVNGNPNTNPGGDPEVIYLSPVEQTINAVTLYSATRFTILQSYINVILKNGGENSFTLDGISQTANFLMHPGDANYKYAILKVDAGNHNLYSDTGYNAIAYGFGNFESYGYNAGTNVKDFSQTASFQNPFGRIDSAVTCVNTPVSFSVPLNFTPSSIRWDFSAAKNITPSTVIGPISNPIADSTIFVNGQNIKYYSPRQSFSFTAANTNALRDTIKMYTTSTTPDGCGSTEQLVSIPVKVNDKPASNFTLTHAGCLQDSVYITAPVTNAVRWLWDLGNGNSLVNFNNTVSPIRYAVANNYTIKLRVVSDIGCASDDASATVSISDKPVANFTAQNITCINAPVKYTDASTIGVGRISKWIWNTDNGSGAITNTTNADQNITYTSFGTKDVRLLVESSTGCKSDTFRLANPVFVHTPPKPGFIIPEVCLNDANAVFTDSTSSADGATNFSYQWNFNAGSPAIIPGPTYTPAQLTAKNPSLKYNKSAVYSVSLKVTSFGCVDSLTSSFTVNGANPTPDFEILTPTKLCSNDSVRIKNLSVVDFGDVTRLEIFWDANDPSKKTIDEAPFNGKVYAFRYPNFQTPATKNYTITLKAFSGNAASCNKSITKTATVNQSPKVSFTTMPGICNEAAPRQITQASFDNNVPGSFAYSGTAVSGTGLFNPVTAGVGTYSIQYMYTSSVIGCKDSASRSITVWPSPTAKWGAGLPSCEKNNLVFTDSSVANFSKIVSWAWDFGDGTTSIKTTGAVFNKIFDTTKTYTVSLKVTTDSGCVSVLNTQLVKVNPLPKPAFSLPSICLPDGNGTFTNSSSIVDGSEASFKYAWNFGDPNNSAGSTSKDPTHKYSTLGPVNVKLVVTTNNNCIDSLTQVLNTIYPQPKAAFTISPDSICMGDVVNFTDQSDGKSSPINKWVWDLGQSDASSVQNPNKRFRDSGIFTIKLYGFNGQNCVSDTVSKTVTSFPYPHLNLGPDFKILEGGTALIKPAFVFGNNLTYKWKPALYLNNDTAAVPRTTPLGDVTYTLELTGLSGCMVTDDIFIKLLLAPEVPNAFSPNGDGINDNWVIKYLESYPGATIDVYNRYGQSVFKSVGYDKPWNGQYNGNPLPIGTYYYIINPKNGRKIITGSVTIIK
jgi:gliding motility-associated-like protein